MKPLLKTSLVALILSLGVPVALAQITNPLAAENLGDVIQLILGQLYIFAIPIVSIMILYGGFQILMAGGSPDKIKTGKRTILYAIVGFIAILVASGVTLLIQDILGVGTEGDDAIRYKECSPGESKIISGRSYNCSCTPGGSCNFLPV